MSQYQIAVVVGSLRRDSFNRKLANALARLAPADFSFSQVEIGDLPLYNQDDDARQADSVQRLKAELAAAQGLLFVTAEYNRSIPGVLKNAIDHASRPYGPVSYTHLDVYKRQVLCRIDTPIEVRYYRSGGILPFVLDELLGNGCLLYTSRCV